MPSPVWFTPLVWRLYPADMTPSETWDGAFVVGRQAPHVPEPAPMPRPIADLMNEARRVLDVSQNGLAEKMGVSRRTGQRWNAGRGPVGTDVHQLARLVYPADAALAEAIAEAGGTTLAALGVLPPALPEPTVLPAPPPPQPSGPPDRVVDAVVCAAAEAMQVMPQSVRPAVLAAFACARELGLTVEGVERVLRSREKAGARG